MCPLASASLEASRFRRTLRLRLEGSTSCHRQAVRRYCLAVGCESVSMWAHVLWRPSLPAEKKGSGPVAIPESDESQHIERPKTRCVTCGGTSMAQDMQEARLTARDDSDVPTRHPDSQRSRKAPEVAKAVESSQTYDAFKAGARGSVDRRGSGSGSVAACLHRATCCRQEASAFERWWIEESSVGHSAHM